MTQVAWFDLGSEKFEKMGAVLLHKIHPDAVHVRGAGGDGGRDVVVNDPDGELIYQLKWFVGRVDVKSGRRRQVEESLQRASNHKPKEWHLVLPTNLTPGERSWFGKLQQKYPFPLSWHGETWLDTQMATYPSIPAYFLDDSRALAMQLILEATQAKGTLARGIPDAVDRMSVLRDRLRELTPFWEINLSTRPDDPITIEPAYVGAEEDDPITIRLATQFPDNAQGRAALRQLDEAMNFGADAELSGEFVKNLAVSGGPAGLADSMLQISSLRVSGVDNPSWSFEADLVLLDPSGARVASLPVRFDDLRRGFRGFTMRGTDVSGSLQITMRVDLVGRASESKLSIKTDRAHYPSTVLPAIRFVLKIAGGSRIRIETGDAGMVAESGAMKGQHLVDRGFVEILEALERIQSRTGTYFPIPGQLSRADLEEITQADALLSGREVIVPVRSYSMTAEPKDATQAAAMHAALAQEGAAAWQFGVTHMVTIAEHEINLGAGWIRLDRARIGNRKALLKRLPAKPGESLQIKLVCVGRRQARIGLGPL